VFVTAEHVEAGEAGAEQNMVAGGGVPGGGAGRFLEGGAHRMGHAVRGTGGGQRRAGIADQKRLFHPGGDAAHEGGEVPTLGLAAGNEEHGRGEPRQRRLDRVEIGGL